MTICFIIVYNTSRLLRGSATNLTVNYLREHMLSCRNSLTTWWCKHKFLSINCIVLSHSSDMAPIDVSMHW